MNEERPGEVLEKVSRDAPLLYFYVRLVLSYDFRLRFAQNRSNFKSNLTSIHWTFSSGPNPVKKISCVMSLLF